MAVQCSVLGQPLILLLVVLIMVFALALCGCDNKKKENQEASNAEVIENVENDENETVEPEKIVLEKNDDNISKFMVSYKNAKFSTGVQFDLIRDLLGKESKPSDTSKVCNPNAKGETTHYYFEGLTVNVNYEGRINEIFIDSETATLRSGIKVGMTPEEVKAIIPEVNEDPYSLNYNVGVDFYSSMIKSDDGKISSISIGDMSIED